MESFSSVSQVQDAINVSLQPKKTLSLLQKSCSMFPVIPILESLQRS